MEGQRKVLAGLFIQGTSVLGLAISTHLGNHIQIINII